MNTQYITSLLAIFLVLFVFSPFVQANTITKSGKTGEYNSCFLAQQNGKAMTNTQPGDHEKLCFSGYRWISHSRGSWSVSSCSSRCARKDSRGNCLQYYYRANWKAVWKDVPHVC